MQVFSRTIQNTQIHNYIKYFGLSYFAQITLRKQSLSQGKQLMMGHFFLLELISWQIEKLKKKLKSLSNKVKLYTFTRIQKGISQTNTGMKLFLNILNLLPLKIQQKRTQALLYKSMSLNQKKVSWAQELYQKMKENGLRSRKIQKYQKSQTKDYYFH